MKGKFLEVFEESELILGNLAGHSKGCSSILLGCFSCKNSKENKFNFAWNI